MSEYHPTPSPSPEPAEAGPSTAPHRHLPKQAFSSVEYPGPVSHPSALLKVVSQEDINECFNATYSPAAPPILEMRYRMEDYAAVPVRGLRAPSQKLLLKITRRRKRVREGDDNPKERDVGEGVFTSEVVGPVTNTVRFRTMADYHFTPNPEGRIASVLQSLRDLDYDAILDYQVPELDESYIEPIDPDPSAEPSDIPFRSLLDLQPPPTFSDRRLPPLYSYKNPPQAVVEEFEDERTGQTRARYVNKARFVGHTPAHVGSVFPGVEVPREPPKSVLSAAAKVDQNLLIKMRKILEERPVWQRPAFLCQLTEQERRSIKTNKAYLPSVVYTIGAGPFSRSLVRLGYDPCADSSSAIYQRVYFYVQVNRSKNNVLNLDSGESGSDEEEDNVNKGTKSWWESEQERRVVAGLRAPPDRNREYIFDGQELHLDRPDYQLCDITDPLIVKFIKDPVNLAETYDRQNGWYKPAALNLIKTLMRIKYMHVRETGEKAPDSLCYSAIEEYERDAHAEESD